MNKLLAVLVALAVATWWCWKPPQHESFPRWPLAHMLEIGYHDSPGAFENPSPGRQARAFADG
jgi:hypothetical protein